MTRPIPFVRLTDAYLITTPTPTTVAFFSRQDGSVKFEYKLPVAPLSAAEEKQRKEKEEADRKKAENKAKTEAFQKAANGGVLKVEENPAPKKGKKQKGKMGKPQEAEARYITAVETSGNGEWVGVTCSDKQVFIFNISASGEVTLGSVTTAAKRPSSLFFLAKTLLLADKFGDVHALSLPSAPFPNNNAQPRLLLGHVSMLLALSSTTVPSNPKRRVIITADRDEHIRISRYPQSHVIENFCLGHTGFVASICVPEGKPGMLISASGDGSLKVWDWEQGKCRQTIDVANQTDLEGWRIVAPMQVVESKGWVAVLVDKVPGFLVFKIKEGEDTKMEGAGEGQESEEILEFVRKVDLPFPPLSLSLSASKIYASLMPQKEAEREDDAPAAEDSDSEDEDVEHIVVVDLKSGKTLEGDKGIEGAEKYMRSLGKKSEDEGKWAELTKAEMLRKFESEQARGGE